MGGSQNVNGQVRSVTGIGIDKAARIAFYTMTNFTNYDAANLDFYTVRSNSLAAAAILYGSNSTEYTRVCQAWYAVNVGGCIGGGSIEIQVCTFKPDDRFYYYKRNGMKTVDGVSVKLAVSPNPAGNTISIGIEEANKTAGQSYTVSILDLQGKIVFSGNYNEVAAQQIDISTLTTGVYIMNITTGNWSRNVKFMKN